MKAKKFFFHCVIVCICLTCFTSCSDDTLHFITGAVVVKLNYNDGSGKEEKVILGHDKEKTLNEVHTKHAQITSEGKTFLGWFTSPSGGVKLNPDDIVSNNITYYAHWVDVADAKLIGGKIFFVDSDNGKSYEFFDITGQSLGVNLTDLNTLSKAVCYKDDGSEKTSDRYFVINWERLNYKLKWSRFSDAMGTGLNVGDGRKNTDKMILTVAANSSDTIWAYINEFNVFGQHGNNTSLKDWYIGSYGELLKATNNNEVFSFLFAGRDVWSSSEQENNTHCAVEYCSDYNGWLTNRGYYVDGLKEYATGVMTPIRSF